MPSTDSTRTGIFLAVWTEEDPVDMTAKTGQRCAQLGMDAVEVLVIHQSEPDRGLVGHDRDTDADMVEAGDRLETAGDRHPCLRRDDGFTVGSNIDDAVAFDDDEFGYRSHRRWSVTAKIELPSLIAFGTRRNRLSSLAMHKPSGLQQ